MEIGHILTTFGGIIGLVFAFFVLWGMMKFCRSQVIKEYRRYLSIGSPIYNPSDWD